MKNIDTYIALDKIRTQNNAGQLVFSVQDLAKQPEVKQELLSHLLSQLPKKWAEDEFVGSSSCGHLDEDGGPALYDYSWQSVYQHNSVLDDITAILEKEMK